MSSTASMPIPDPLDVPRNRREAQLLPTNQPLPSIVATHHQRVIWEGPDPHTARHNDTRMCTHWPDGCVAQIQAAARFLRDEADNLTRSARIETPATRYPGCLDLDTLPLEPTGNVPMRRLAALWAQVLTQKLALRVLADDFSTISEWLEKAAELSWDAAKAMRQQPDLAVAIGESQRLISKDSLSADVNALIAAMLRRAVKLLDRLDLAPGGAHADLAGQRACARTLAQTAELLDNAAHLAAEAAGFVEEFDRRWRQMRHKVARAVALTASAATSMPSSP